MHQPVRDLGQLRLLSFSPYSSESDGAAVESSLLRALSLRGEGALQVVCDGVLPVCDLYSAAQPRGPLACSQCQAAAAVQAHVSEVDFHWLSRYLRPEEAKSARRWVLELLSGELDQARHGTWELGRWMERSLAVYLAGDRMRPPGVIEQAKRVHLEGGLKTALALRRLLDERAPEVLLIHDGEALPLRVAQELQLERGGLTIAHEIDDDRRLLLHESVRRGKVLRRRS